MRYIETYLTPAGILVCSLVVLGAMVFLGATLGFWFGSSGNESHPEANIETVKDHVLVILPKDIEYGNGAVWHAWTFNGTVPGPTLKVNAGETMRVKVINAHDMVHSFHAHLDGYSFENDGSQANYLTGEGLGGMISPGSEYTWEFTPPTPGLYYYHTHSADKGMSPTKIVGQGLYGAIIVQDPEEPPMREEVLFMGEVGFDTEGVVAPFVFNGMGLPGGEVALEEIFGRGGYAAVAEQYNKTLPHIKAKVGEPFKLHVINIGNLEHSLYIHSATVVSLGVLGGRPWPARVLPLVQGAADTLLINFDHPGMWLFHCHVEPHADAGMIGIFEVEA